MREKTPMKMHSTLWNNDTKKITKQTFLFLCDITVCSFKFWWWVSRECGVAMSHQYSQVHPDLLVKNVSQIYLFKIISIQQVYLKLYNCVPILIFGKKTWNYFPVGQLFVSREITWRYNSLEMINYLKW